MLDYFQNAFRISNETDKHLAEELEVTVGDLKDRIEFFKNDGCALFK